MSQALIDGLALAFVLLRILHGTFYVLDLGYWRSTVWFGAAGCVIALFLLSA